MLNVSLTSDFRYRGVSLSDEQPALTAGLAYDHPSGAYISAVAISARTSKDRTAYLGEQIYAGVAFRDRSGVNWDFGGARTQVKTRGEEPYAIRYTEIYAGASTSRLNAYLYFAPDYMGEGVSTVYVSAGGSRSLNADWKIVGRAGALIPFDTKPDSEIRKTQYDTSLALARRIGPIDAQLQWTWHGPHGGYSPEHRQSSQALALTATLTF